MSVTTEVFLIREKNRGAKFKAWEKPNINNLIYADDTTLTAESEEELKSFLKVKEESEKAGLKLSIQKTKIVASGPIISWQCDLKSPGPQPCGASGEEPTY